MFFERHEGGETAVLVHLEMKDEGEREDPQEFMELVNSTNVSSAAFITANSQHPNPAFLLAPVKWKKFGNWLCFMGQMSLSLTMPCPPVRNETWKKN